MAVALLGRSRMEILNNRNQTNGLMAMVSISLPESDATVLRDFLAAKLAELRREELHTDSRRFRDMLYQLEAVLQGVIAQLPSDETGGKS